MGYPISCHIFVAGREEFAGEAWCCMFCGEVEGGELGCLGNITPDIFERRFGGLAGETYCDPV